VIEPHAVAVSVCDNGAGLPIDHKQGLGMIGMRERILALGGKMTVLSTPRGVTVEAMVPCNTRQLQAVGSL
jgi:two-component system, NarL family, sensor histidine kinase UhpB